MKDEWVTSALNDDALVAELLRRLKQSSSLPEKHLPSLSLPVGWGHRQPRSKPKKDLPTTATTTRYSPTTPLSWSDGGYDYDYNSNSNSSRPSSDPSRSKDAFTNDTSICSNSKRSKKKKTFAELKEEENLLLKERVTLKRELASLHVTFEEQKARSENLKRMKIDLNLQTSGETSHAIEVAVANQCNQMEASTNHHPHLALPIHDNSVQDHGLGSSGSSCRGVEKEVDTQKSCFVLPDLNMMPSDEEIVPEILNGVN
ncbi:hypothetical protein ACH5RR_040042 [Cinchona calisaya]|uniref:Uncharacterized protein n=1 Tax=Cinchona calisaya TaxID=153742 RepID=A0ABD2XTX8_9GENT